MQERKEPFRKVRLAVPICEALEKKRLKDRYMGSFNGYVESILSQIAADIYIPEGTRKIEQIQKTLMDLRNEFFHRVNKTGRERVEVRDHRPTRESDDRIRKAG